MKKEIKEKWLNALRSGEYKQGTEVLKNYDKFCCLGVLCDIHSKENNKEWEKDEDEVERYLRVSLVLPLEVQEWAEIKGENPIIPISFTKHSDDGNFLKFDESSLAELNDNGKSFAEIADIIEKHL